MDIVKEAVEWWVGAISGHESATAEKIEKFKEILASKIEIEIQQKGFMELITDYYPEGQLAESAFASTISGVAFPKKTYMDISPREVGVRQNFSPSRKLIYKEKNEVEASNSL
jgi:hypothetical protein